jgi:hypothetical protein
MFKFEIGFYFVFKQQVYLKLVNSMYSIKIVLKIYFQHRQSSLSTIPLWYMCVYVCMYV